MNDKQLEQTLRQDATRLALPEDAALQQRIHQAVLARARSQSKAMAPQRPARMRWLQAASLATVAALLLLISLPTRTPLLPSPAENTLSENNAIPALLQVEQQLQRQLVSNEKALLQEWQRIDLDWQRAVSVLLPVTVTQEKVMR